MAHSTPDLSSLAACRTSRLFVVLWLLWGAMILAIRIAYPGLELGDGLNDADILHASNWYAVHGYAETTFLPVRETAFHPDFWPPTYNTFPPGVFWLHELLRRAGLSELWHFRIASVLLAQTGVWLWFILVRCLTRSAGVACASAVVYMISRPYLSYAPGFWEHVPMLTLFGTLAAWVRYEQASEDRTRWKWLAVATLLNFVDNWLTVQHACMIALIIGVRVIVHITRSGNWMRLFAAGVVCVMPAVVLALRFFHQVLHSGTVAQALAYFRDPVTYRLGELDPTLTRLGAMYWWLLRLGAPGTWQGKPPPSSTALFPIFHWLALSIAAVLLSLLIWRWRRPENQPFRLAILNGLLLLAGAMTWPLVMKQHASMHAFPVLMFIPGAALFMGGLMAFAFCWAKSFATHVHAAPRRNARDTPHLPARTALVLLAFALFVPIIRDLRRSDTLNRVFRLDRTTYTNVRQVAARVPVLEEVGAALPKGVVLRFSPRWPSIPYSVARPFYQTNRPLDARRVPDELFVLDMNDPPIARITSSMAIAFGMPDFPREPGRLAVFPPVISQRDPMTRSACPDLPLLPGVRIVESRWAKTIDGRASVASVLIDGLMTQTEAAARVLHVQITDDRGRPIADRRADLGVWGTRSVAANLGFKQPRSNPGLLAWFEFPLDVWERAAVLRFEVIGTQPAVWTMRASHSSNTASGLSSGAHAH